MWVRIKETGQELEMVEGHIVLGPGNVAPGARALIAQGIAEEIEPPKAKPVQMTSLPPVTPEGERANRDVTHDPLWGDAYEVCRKVGLPKDATMVVYRGLKNRELLEQLEARLTAIFASELSTLTARIAALEAQIKKEQDHGQTEQSTSTARNGSGQTRGRVSAAGR